MCDDHDMTRSAGLTRRKLLLLGAGIGLLPVSLACSSRTEGPAAGAEPTATGPNSPGSPGPPSLPQASIPPPSPTAPPPPVVTTATLHCRESWGAAPIRQPGRVHSLTRLTLHHSAVLLDDNGEMAARLRQHQRYHQDELGWIDIAYHIAVDREGQLYELRPAKFVGDTATPYDPRGHFLVLVEGNFEQQQVTEEQLNGAAMAFAWASQKHNIPTSTLRGHKDVTPTTACPGTNLEAFIANGDLEQRVNALISRGPVEFTPTCATSTTGAVGETAPGY